MNSLPLLFLLAGQADVEQPDAVAAFHCSGRSAIELVSVHVTQVAYNWRSIAIVKAGLAGDVSRLNSMVSPSVSFALWRGDAAWAPHSTGANAAVEFAKWWNPKTFQVSSAIAGPILVDPCVGANAELLLQRGAAGEAAVITFKYRDGVLIRVEGHEVEMVNGAFEPAGAK